MKKGFTLMELIVVVVIIGILAMAGLPQYFKVAERGRSAEGISILGTVRSAQLRFAASAEDGLTSGNLTDLDVETTELKYFNAPVPTAGINPRTAASNTTLVAIARKGGYTLNIAVNGAVTCEEAGSVTCPKITK